MASWTSVPLCEQHSSITQSSYLDEVVECPIHLIQHLVDFLVLTPRPLKLQHMAWLAGSKLDSQRKQVAHETCRALEIANASEVFTVAKGRKESRRNTVYLTSPAACACRRAFAVGSSCRLLPARRTPRAAPGRLPGRCACVTPGHRTGRGSRVQQIAHRGRGLVGSIEHRVAESVTSTGPVKTSSLILSTRKHCLRLHSAGCKVKAESSTPLGISEASSLSSS